MDLYDKFKRFLGLNPPPESPSLRNEERNFPLQPQQDDDSFEPPFHQNPSRHFNVFTDPLEIHRYFEQQMSDMLKSFGFGEFGDGFSHHFEFPQLEDLPEEEYSVPSGELRDQFLKPGYESGGKGHHDEKKDSDIDGKLDVKDWGSVFRGDPSGTPFQRQVTPKTHFFGQSVTSKTVRNPDGSIETHHTVRDSQGNEETTITRKMGDKEYSVTKRRDKDGKEEIIENMVNLEEKDVKSFIPAQPEQLPENEPKPWPLFDKFFR